MNLNDRYYARFGLEYNPFIKLEFEEVQLWSD